MLRGCGVEVRLVVARPVDPSDLSSIPGDTDRDLAFPEPCYEVLDIFSFSVGFPVRC